MPPQIRGADFKAARRLLQSITAELRVATRHFSERNGRELRTAVETLQEMHDHGYVILELPPGRPQADYLGPVNQQQEETGAPARDPA